MLELDLVFASLMPIILFIAGIQWEKRKSTPHKNQIFKDTLFNVLEPLEKILQKKHANIEEFKIKMIEISENHYSFVPKDIMAFYDDVSTTSNIHTIKSIVSSNYNWTKKKLGYPFSQKKILDKYIPTYERNENIFGIMTILLTLFVALAPMLFIYFTDEDPSVTKYVAALVLSLVGVLYMDYRRVFSNE